MDKRLVGTFLVMVATASCGPYIPHGWVRSGIPHAEAQREFAACQLEAQRVIPDAPRISSPRSQGQVTTYQGTIGSQQVYGTATTQPQAQRTWADDLADQIAADNRVRSNRDDYAQTCMRAKGYHWGPLVAVPPSQPQQQVERFARSMSALTEENIRRQADLEAGKYDERIAREFGGNRFRLEREWIREYRTQLLSLARTHQIPEQSAPVQGVLGYLAYGEAVADRGIAGAITRQQAKELLGVGQSILRERVDELWWNVHAYRVAVWKRVDGAIVRSCG